MVIIIYNIFKMSSIFLKVIYNYQIIENLCLTNKDLLLILRKIKIFLFKNAKVKDKIQCKKAF